MIADASNEEGAAEGRRTDSSAAAAQGAFLAQHRGNRVGIREQSTASTALESGSPRLQRAKEEQNPSRRARMEGNKVASDGASSDPLFRVPPKKLSLSFQDIRFETSKGKVLLSNVTGFVAAGEMCGILGPSGSGKTCLLDVLAMRRKKGGALKEGKVLYSGKPLKSRSKGESMCYIGQEDVLIDALTVRETVSFAVRLEYGYSISQKSLNRLVNAILDDTGLRSSADVRTGDPISGKGISGGQRRRLMIAVELVSCPAVMILDEPTSGLDFASAFGVMKELKAMARIGHTVLTVVHQPSSQIWSLFDKVAFLSEGSFVYFGPPAKLVGYFETLGHVCPEFYNPAEFVMELIKPALQDKSESGAPRLDSLKDAFAQSTFLQTMKTQISEEIQSALSRESKYEGVKTAMLKDGEDAEDEAAPVIKPHAIGVLTSARVLLHRNCIDAMRNPGALFARWALIAILAFLMGLTYFRMGDRFNDESIRSRASALFFLPTFTGLVSMSMIPHFMHNRAVIKKELGNGRYSVWAFALSFVLPMIVSAALIAISVSLISFFMMGFRNFGEYLLVMFTNYLLMELLVLASAAIVSHYLVGMLLVISILACGMATQGFFIVFHRINWSIRWIGYITPQRYMYHALLRNEFETMGNLTSPFYPTGVDYLEFWGVYKSDSVPTYWYNMLVVLGFILAFFVAYFAALRTWQQS